MKRTMIIALTLFVALSANADPMPGETKVAYEQRVVAEQRAKDAAHATQSAQAAALRALPANPWVYTTSEDRMGRGTSKLARVPSINTVSLDFPYQGEQYAVLMLRNSPRSGKEVMLTVQRGQFSSTYSRNYVTVKFDDGELQKFVIAEADNGATGLLFIGDEKRFIRQLSKAKQIKLEVLFYQYGQHVFEFDVHGLDQSWQ
jgi:hypothetical protein